MKNRISLAVFMIGFVAACGDDPTSVTPSEEGLTVRVAGNGSPGFAERFDVVRATVRGAAEHVVTLEPDGAGGFSGTLPALVNGTYAVSVTGLIGGEVDHFGRVDDFELSGTRATATVPFTTFVPALAAIPSPTTDPAPPIAFAAIAQADSYLVDISRTADFTAPVTRSLAAPGSGVAATDSGRHYVRVRAVSADAGTGRASAPVDFRITTDAASGDDPATATDLGFAVTAAGTYGDLNILPAGDLDWFALSACTDDVLTIRVSGAGGDPTGFVPELQIRETSGGTLVLSDNESNGEAVATLLVAQDGPYHLRVAGRDGGTGAYELHVSVARGTGTGETGCTGPEPAPQGRISGGMVHSCAVAAGGQAYCWGDNGFGQMGTGNRTRSGTPVPVSGGVQFLSVSAGWQHSCGVSVDHDAYCWGRNDDGRLGNGSFTGSETPTMVAGGLKFHAVDAGVSHTCGITTAGELYCWGDNAFNQVGDPSTQMAALPVRAASTRTFRRVSAGFRHSCALTTSGWLFCWGADEQGQIGNGGGVSDAVIPQRVDGGRTFVDVSAGYQHSCGVEADGTAFCWGNNRIGQLGDGTSYNFVHVPQAVPSGLSFRAISAAFGADTTAGAHTCALTTSGDAYCWGLNVTGQLGSETTELCDKQDIIDVKQFPCSTLPRAVVTGLQFVALTTGMTHTCGLTAAGEAHCWGDNQVGQSGEGAEPTTVPTVVVGGMQIERMFPSTFHTCALLADSTAACWGWNPYGQLGDGTTDLRIAPVSVAGGLRFATFATGADHTCGTTGDGTGFCWGKGTHGQLGNGSMVSSLSPTEVADARTWRVITAGDLHTCGLTADSLAYCWGEGAEGRLGTGRGNLSTTPDAVAFGLRYRTLSAGNIHACGAAETGALYCWGYNSDGQIGNGAGASNDFSATPDSVLTTEDFVETTTGFYHTCGVTADGKAYCWGDNDSGQLGDGSLTDRKSPVQVAEGISFTSVQAGFYHTCGLATTGQVYCWGDNLWGQLGNGDTTDRDEPVAVLGGQTFASLFTGDDHTCGITATGETYCWGRNCRGQLGVGRRGMTYAPTPVFGGLTFLEAAGG